MSFSFEFTATRENADRIIAQEHAPDSVVTFISRALGAFEPGALVYVKAFGHLFNNDHKISNASIEVREVLLRVPKT